VLSACITSTTLFWHLDASADKILQDTLSQTAHEELQEKKPKPISQLLCVV